MSMKSADRHLLARGRRHLARGVAVCLVLFLSSSLTPAGTLETRVVRLATRPNVEQSYLLLREASPVKAIALLFTGGYGLFKFQGEGDDVKWSPQANSFLMINRVLFADEDTAVAIVDVPSDQWNFGATPKFRKSESHATDMRGVIGDLKIRFPGARVYLVGTSQGSTSAAFVGKAMGKDIDGVVLTASVFEWAPASWGALYDSNLTDFDFSQIHVPLLIVHHRDDPCVVTPYKGAAKLAGKYPVISVSGGALVQDNGCGPRGPHGFMGREQAVVAEIKNWMNGRDFLREIP